jgi:hypothetical protein
MSSTNEQGTLAMRHGEDANAGATITSLVRTMSGHFGLAKNQQHDHTLITQAAYPKTGFTINIGPP